MSLKVTIIVTLIDSSKCNNTLLKGVFYIHNVIIDILSGYKRNKYTLLNKIYRNFNEGDEMTTILAVVGDLHVNSTVGLIKPSVNLDGGGTYNSSPDQRRVWRNWLSFWKEVSTVAEKHKADVWTVFNGDMVDVFVKHETVEIISRNDADVFDMALDTIEPAIEVSDENFVVRGTAAHGKSGGVMEEKIAGDIGAVPSEENDSWWELLLECDGVLYDITHHGGLGRLEWTKANALNKLVARLIIAYRNKRCPDVALRSHNHQYARSDDSLDIEAFALPAWQLFTEHTRRIGAIGLADIGGMYFINDKGTFVPVKKRYPQPMKKTWKG